MTASGYGLRECPRCGQRFEVYNTDDRYDAVCAAQVEARDRKPAEPAFVPTWRRAPFGKALDSGRPA